jgi:hypothetical protein
MASNEAPKIHLDGNSLKIPAANRLTFGHMVLRLVNHPAAELDIKGLPQEAETALRPYLLGGPEENIVIPAADIPITQNVARQTVLFDLEITELLKWHSGEAVLASIFAPEYHFNPRTVKIMAERAGRTPNEQRLLQMADIANQILDATSGPQETAV